MHEHRQKTEDESMAYNKMHLLIMALCCLIPIAILTAIVYTNLSRTYIPFLLVLLCPLLMLLMHLPRMLPRKRRTEEPIRFDTRMAKREKTTTKAKRQEHEPDHATYVPAFSYDFMTPIYDFMMKWAARESAFKPRLMEQARIEKGHKVLDVGCGTATLTILIKKAHPEAEVIGLDGDPKILEIAKSKVAKAGLDIALDYGMASELPYHDNIFDHVVSSMVFHHLTRENKDRTLREVFRVLKPEGEFHIADLGKPRNVLMYLPSLIIRHLEEASENVKGLLPEMFRSVGFDHVEETANFMTIFGTLTLYKARKIEPLAMT